MELEIDSQTLNQAQKFNQTQATNQCKCTDYLDHIPILDDTSYPNFFKNFLIKNQACLIKNVSNSWEASRFWTENNSPNFKYLHNKYGDSDVTIYDCKDKYYNSQKTFECKFNDYLNYWEAYIKSSYDQQMPVHYLKDWHLKLQNPSDKFYEVPQPFGSDWLNEYLSENGKDDYRFVYMGPKGTWTPFHADVFTSYSWSVNVCGKKRWLLFPPGNEAPLRDNLKNLPYDVSSVAYKVKHFEIIQNQGDAIFVPSGWYHQVWNLEDTISINHNWVNGCNIMKMFQEISTSLDAIKKEIQDCLDMENFQEHTQLMLKVSFGIDFKSFYRFIMKVALKRLTKLKENVNFTVFDEYTYGKNHIVFDLVCIKNVLGELLQHEDTNLFNDEKVGMSPKELNNYISSTIESL